MAQPRPPINPQPKSRFQKSAEAVKLHRKMIDSEEFQRAVDMALLQFQLELTQTVPDMSTAASNHYRMHGALQFVHLLKNLSEPALVATKPPQTDNLQHNV